MLEDKDILSPVLGSGRSVPLSPVFKPISYLSGSQACRLGQLSLFTGVRIRI